MKKEVTIVVSIIGIVFACFALARKERKEQYLFNSGGYALVELYSTEGCSSSPPAEAVMRKLIGKVKVNAESFPVYVVEFHVDYWDYLGWKDTFAMAEYSQRQQDYGNFFKLNSIYTPQAIINGKVEMVGSDE